jgi:hypothetical protein
MIKRAIPLLVHGANQTGLSSSFNVSNGDDLPPDDRDVNSPLALWIPELNPLRWLVINVMWCIAYTVPLVALFWRTKNEFFYGATFYYTVNIASCITWVAQTALSSYWFWNRLGLARTIELVLSLYFVLDALLIIFLRDTSNLTTFDVVLDYGVSLVAYTWALELGIKSYLEAKQGFATVDVQEDLRISGYEQPSMSSIIIETKVEPAVDR